MYGWVKLHNGISEIGLERVVYVGCENYEANYSAVDIWYQNISIVLYR